MPAVAAICRRRRSSGRDSRPGPTGPRTVLGAFVPSRCHRPGRTCGCSAKQRGRTVKRNAGASLVDLDDGVLAVEFHSKLNTIGGDTVEMLTGGVKEASQRFDGLVVGNDAVNFLCQHLEAPARARLWRQSQVAHAAADGRWYAAEPPGPRGGPSWCLDQPPGRALRAFEAILGPGGPRCAGFVVGETATGQYEHTILDLRRAPSATGC